MQKRLCWILLLLFLVVFSIPTYSYLSDSEKNRLEACPLKTYINVTGNGIYGIGCKDIVIEKGFDFIYVKTMCDYNSIAAFINTDERSGGNAIKEGEIWKLHDFRAKANPYFLTCVINKTKLEDIKYIWVYVKTRSELEAEARGKELIKKLDVIINKSDETLKEINKTSNIVSEIGTTTKQTNMTLTKAQESQNCKNKFGLLPEFLGLILGSIFVIIGLINKRNKKLQRRWWILAAIVIILIIITRISIVFYICKF